jgi:pimeloyl-ACP methyl ester carboxylesterase
MPTTAIELNTVTLDDGLTLTYRELGYGPPVLLLHGWPTSSYLWRNVMPAIARDNCAVALDLPGFGGSDKPVERYGFSFFEQVLTRFLDKLEMDPVGLVGHDIGGPIAAHWAMRNQDRVTGLALLNTLLYPEFAPEIVEFATQLADPARRDALTSQEGLADIMRLGVTEPAAITDEIMTAVTAPFRDENARQALALAGIGLSPRGFRELADGLPALRIPLRVIYGERDRILPDVGQTMARLKRDVPHAHVTPLATAGHFIQEEVPEQLGELLRLFFKPEL